MATYSIHVYCYILSLHGMLTPKSFVKYVKEQSVKKTEEWQAKAQYKYGKWNNKGSCKQYLYVKDYTPSSFDASQVIPC